MKEIEATLKEIGSKSGLDIALDENGSWSSPTGA